MVSKYIHGIHKYINITEITTNLGNFVEINSLFIIFSFGWINWKSPCELSTVYIVPLASGNDTQLIFFVLSQPTKKNLLGKRVMTPNSIKCLKFTNYKIRLILPCPNTHNENKPNPKSKLIITNRQTKCMSCFWYFVCLFTLRNETSFCGTIFK